MAIILNDEDKRRKDARNTLSPAAMPPQALRMPATGTPSPAAASVPSQRPAAQPPARPSFGVRVGQALAYPSARRADYFSRLSQAAPTYASDLQERDKANATAYAEAKQRQQQAWERGETFGGYAEPNIVGFIRGVKEGYASLAPAGQQPAAEAAPAPAASTQPAEPTQAAQQPAPTADKAPAKPPYWDEAAAERTRSALRGQPDQQSQPPATAYTMDTVPEGGAYMEWGAPGKGERRGERFRRPGNISITPEQARAMAAGVNTVPAESFARPMPSSDEALANARFAAADRGDFDAVRRSYLSPDERRAENRQNVERRALDARRQLLESRAREPLATTGSPGRFYNSLADRRLARSQLDQLNEADVKARELAASQAQQGFGNEIALLNAQANQMRAQAAFNRPGRWVPQTRKVFDESGFQVGEETVLINDATGETRRPEQAPSMSGQVSEDDIQATIAATGLPRDRVMEELRKRGVIQ